MLCGVEAPFLSAFVQPNSSERQETVNSQETLPRGAIGTQPGFLPVGGKTYL